MMGNRGVSIGCFLVIQGSPLLMNDGCIYINKDIYIYVYTRLYIQIHPCDIANNNGNTRKSTLANPFYSCDKQWHGYFTSKFLLLVGSGCTTPTFQSRHDYCGTQIHSPLLPEQSAKTSFKVFKKDIWQGIKMPLGIQLNHKVSFPKYATPILVQHIYNMALPPFKVLPLQRYHH